MRSSVVLALAAVATATQIRSGNPRFAANNLGCITASSNADGAPVLSRSCLNFGTDMSSQNWNLAFNGVPQQVRVFGNRCLDVKDGVNADGTGVQVWSCVTGNTNQLWIPLSGSTFQWFGTNKCLDLTDGILTDGNPLQVWTCFQGNDNQRWSTFVPPPASGTGQFRTTGMFNKTNSTTPSPLCLTASANNDGARVSLDVCGSSNETFPTGNDAWVFPLAGSSGPITTFGGTKCLDVTDGVATNGNLLQVWSCFQGNTNQMFSVSSAGASGALSLSWLGRNKCVDVRDGVFAPGNASIQIWDCVNGNTNQQWFSQSQAGTGTGTGTATGTASTGTGTATGTATGTGTGTATTGTGTGTGSGTITGTPTGTVNGTTVGTPTGTVNGTTVGTPTGTVNGTTAGTPTGTQT